MNGRFGIADPYLVDGQARDTLGRGYFFRKNTLMGTPEKSKCARSWFSR